MNSLQKKLSVSQLYSELQKYQSNLTSSKQSRINKDSCASSQPKLSEKSSYQSSQNFSYQTKGKPCEKKNQGYLNGNQKVPTIDQQNSYHYDSSKQWKDRKSCNIKGLNSKKRSHNQSELRDEQAKENKLFTKKDEFIFVKECNELYSSNGIKEKDLMKHLMKEINKRDEVYEWVVDKFGSQNTMEKVKSFFEEYHMMAAIIKEFKNMSKLQIEDYHELYCFLKSETQFEEEEVSHPIDQI